MPIDRQEAEKLKAIILQGDAETLVSYAEPLAQRLVRGGLKSSQLRNIFGEARKIQAQWRLGAESRRNEWIRMKPKLAYQAARFRTNRADPVTPLAECLAYAIDIAIGTHQPEHEREYFKNFMDLFEAIVAYHKANGGEDGGN